MLKGWVTLSLAGPTPALPTSQVHYVNDVDRGVVWEEVRGLKAVSLGSRRFAVSWVHAQVCLCLCLCPNFVLSQGQLGLG